MNPNDAEQALSDMQAARLRAQGRPLPLAYSTGFALLMTALLLAQAVPLVWRGALVLGCAILTGAMYRWQRRYTGRWVNGFRAGRTRWVAGAIMVVFLVLMALSSPLVWHDHAPLSIGWACALMLVTALVLDRLWVRAYASDVRDGR